jgi:hypothetical protein
MADWAVVALLFSPTAALPAWLWLRGRREVAPQICRRCHLVPSPPRGDLPRGTVTLRTVVCHDCRELDARAARLRAGTVRVG